MVKGWEVKKGSGLSEAFAFGLNFVLFGGVGQIYEETLMTWGTTCFEKKKKLIQIWEGLLEKQL